MASISFETTTAQEFLHIDFMTNNTVRIDDDDATEFGSFPRDQVFLVQVTLNISAAQSTVQVVLSGGVASGTQNYTMPPPFHILSLQFREIRVSGAGIPVHGRLRRDEYRRHARALAIGKYRGPKSRRPSPAVTKGTYLTIMYFRLRMEVVTALWSGSDSSNPVLP